MQSVERGCCRPRSGGCVIPRRAWNECVSKRSITADTALRLARFFGTSAELWMNLQAHYDLEVARDELEERVKREITPYT